jgi:hypothetical protein
VAGDQGTPAAGTDQDPDQDTTQPNGEKSKKGDQDPDQDTTQPNGKESKKSNKGDKGRGK